MEKPTAKHIVARLTDDWGGRLELLHLLTRPYECYYDDGGEEVPFDAIERWQEVII